MLCTYEFECVLMCIMTRVMDAFCPPSPRVCGSSGGPAVEGPRIKLRDGRHLAYKEHGVAKHRAKYNIILLHGFGSSRNQASIAASAWLWRARSDPNRTIQSMAFDIEEVGDQLGLGAEFYVIGTSMGGQLVWGCLKHIPHWLAGAAMIAPVVNYWWPSFPVDLWKEAYYLQSPRDQWALRVAHYAPSLVYWWNTQKWFPCSSMVAGMPNFTAPYLKILSSYNGGTFNRDYATQQGVHESLHRDMLVGFGHWDFDPLNDLDDPFPDSQGSVHVWHGVEDGLVPVILQRYIAQRLPWVRYHEVPNAEHLFALADDDVQNAILSTLLIGE